MIDLMQNICIILQATCIIILCKRLRLYSKLLNILELRQTCHYKFYDKRLSKLEHKTIDEMLYEELINDTKKN